MAENLKGGKNSWRTQYITNVHGKTLLREDRGEEHRKSKKTLVFERVKSGTKNRANGAVIPKIAPAGGVNILPGPVATIIEVGPGRAEKKSFRAAGLSGQARNHL